MPIRVRTPAGIAEFPDGTDPAVIKAALAKKFPATTSPPAPTPTAAPLRPVASHQPRPEEIAARFDPNYLPPATVTQMAQNMTRQAPAAGAMAATGALTAMAPPLGMFTIPAAMAAAGVGGAGGALARGDPPRAALQEGGKQALLEGGGRAVVGTGGLIAHGLMKGAIPRAIRANFGQVDVPQEMLNRGAFPGVPPSARRIEGLSKIANAERDAAAQTVPRMSPVRGVRDLREEYQHARDAGMPGEAAQVMTAAKEAVADMRQPPMSSRGLTGVQQLKRKDRMQDRATAALRGSDALQPTIANKMRSSVLGHLRETPRMARALDESQTLMAMDEAMQGAALDNPLTRARIGGLTAASLTPVGLGVTAHGVNQARQIANPTTLRLLNALLSQRSNTEEQ